MEKKSVEKTSFFRITLCTRLYQFILLYNPIHNTHSPKASHHGVEGGKGSEGLIMAYFLNSFWVLHNRNNNKQRSAPGFPFAPGFPSRPDSLRARIPFAPGFPSRPERPDFPPNFWMRPSQTSSLRYLYRIPPHFFPKSQLPDSKQADLQPWAPRRHCRTGISG